MIFWNKMLLFHRRRKSRPRQSAEDVYFSKSGEPWDSEDNGDGWGGG